MDDSRKLLSEGLDLCVRARLMDAVDRREAALSASTDRDAWQESGQFARHVERHNVSYVDSPMATRSGTIALWVQEQYEADLIEWERRVRRHLQQSEPTP